MARIVLFCFVLFFLPEVLKEIESCPHHASRREIRYMQPNRKPKKLSYSNVPRSMFDDIP